MVFKSDGLFERNGKPRPGLSGALFAKRSGAKKRERKTDEDAQIIIAVFLKSKYLCTI